MSDSDRKATREEAERPSRRSVLRRARRKEEGEPGDDKTKGGGKPPAQGKAPRGKPASEKKAKMDPKAEGKGATEPAGDVSSLLETTGNEVRQLLKAADAASKQIREAAQTEASTKGSGPAAAAGEAGSLVSRINKEVQQVLESADDAAEKIREEARGEARQVVDEARRRAEAVTRQQIDRVSAMTEQMVEEISAIQERLSNLHVAYDQAMRTMNADLSEHESEVWETKQNGEVESEGETEELRRRLGRRTSRKGAQEPEEISEGARLLALQQMMAGVDPEVIERRLRTEFGIDDPKPILDWMGMHADVERQTPKKR